MSLVDFAARLRNPASRCLVCALPKELISEISENERAPMARRIPRRVVVDYLRERGHDVSTGSLYRHFANHDRTDS